MENTVLNVISLVFAATAIVISIISIRISLKQRRIEEAAKIVVKIDGRKLDEEGKACSFCGIPSMPIIIQSSSNGEFRDVFIIWVHDKEQLYAGKRKFLNRIKDLKCLSQSIENRNYVYINSLINREECWVPAGGGGMNKTAGIVLLFKDSFGNEWLKDTDNKLYPIKGMKAMLFGIGLQNPGYERPI
ncbi:MAG: hypothetical protein H2212_07240 [Ruminococcus sp.]|nr:hypothetical protein [Ruminococcus sp.]